MNGAFKLHHFFKNSPWCSALLLFLLCLIGLQINLGRNEANFDELYHVLAAQGWLEHGEPRIAEGTYDRVLVFTVLVAWLFDLFGVSLAVGRQPSVIAGALLVALLFCWSWYRIGKSAAWIIALLFATSPFFIEVAQFIRFYAFQALAYYIGAVCIYESLDKDRWRGLRLILGLVAATSLAVAYYFQPVTVIGTLGIFIWAASAYYVTWLRNAGLSRKAHLTILLGLVIVCLGAGAFVLTGDLGTILIKRYSSAPTWANRWEGMFFYYHSWLALYYPTFWTLMPILCLVAVASKPRPAWFAILIFSVAFLLHSFAAAKGLRYIFYAIPFLFIIWGAALADLLQRVVGFVQERLEWVSESVTPRLAKVLKPTFWFALVTFMLLANAATVRSITLLAGINVPPDLPPVLWAEVKPQLLPWLDTADVVITNDELSALHYLGRYDLLYNRSRASEIKGEQLARDSRTGRPVISNQETLVRIMECNSTGLVVSSATGWGHDQEIDMAAAEAVVDRSLRIDLPEDSGVVAFRWEHEVTSKDLLNCPAW